MRHLTGSSLLVAFAVLATAVPVLAADPVPVMIGGSEDVDACMSVGRVKGLNPEGDNFLAVRDGPGTGHAKLDEVHEGDTFFLCDEREGWFGIVYQENWESCEVTWPVSVRLPYRGVCKAGWVAAEFVELIAG